MHGFMLAAIRAPMLLIDSAARLIEIRDNSYPGALDPTWANACRLQRVRLLEFSQNASDAGAPRALPVFARKV